MDKGLMIAVEGIDGAGKTTLINLIKTKLLEAGIKVTVFSEASIDEINYLIKSMNNKNSKYKYDEYAHLFLSLSEFILLEKEIEKLLMNKQVVIWDRYFASSIVYSAALGVDYNWLLQFWQNIPNPDLTIFYDCDVTEAWERRKININEIELGFCKDVRIQKETSFINFQSKVSKYYSRLFTPYIKGMVPINNEHEMVNLITDLLEKESRRNTIVKYNTN